MVRLHAHSIGLGSRADGLRLAIALARVNKSPAAAAPTTATTADLSAIKSDVIAKTIKAKKPPVVALRAKRKASDKLVKQTPAASTDKKQKVSDASSKEKQLEQKPKPAPMGLVAYGSDSDGSDA